MRGFWRRLAALLILAGIAAGALAEGPGLGDPAPEIEVLAWVKGDAVTLESFKGKNVVLLDIFSIYDPRVPAQVKHLNELVDKHGAAGLKVVGLAVENEDDVRKFVEKLEFKYPVGIDNMRNTLGGYGRPEPPLAAIVDKEGRMVWRGYVGAVDPTLEKVVSGKFDLERAKKVADLERELYRQAPTQDADLIEPAADALLAEEPSHENGIKLRKFCFAKRDDVKGWREWIAKQVPKMTDAPGLNSVAWDIATDGNLEWREPGAALAAAKKAVELTQGKDGAILDTLARVYCEVGLLDRALDTQKKAIAALDPNADEAEKKQYQTTLAYYEACVALAKQQKPEPPAKPDPKKKK